MAKKVYLGMIGDIMHPGYINIINEGAKYHHERYDGRGYPEFGKMTNKHTQN